MRSQLPRPRVSRASWFYPAPHLPRSRPGRPSLPCRPVGGEAPAPAAAVTTAPTSRRSKGLSKPLPHYEGRLHGLQSAAKASKSEVLGRFQANIEVDPSPPDAALHMHRCDALCSIALFAS